MCVHNPVNLAKFVALPFDFSLWKFMPQHLLQWHSDLVKYRIAFRLPLAHPIWFSLPYIIPNRHYFLLLLHITKWFSNPNHLAVS